MAEQERFAGHLSCGADGEKLIEEWLIDGCNLLHGFKSAGGYPPDISRSGLCGILSQFASSRHVKITLVFDGIGPDAEFETFFTAFFKARFSQKVTADTAIERYLYEKKAGLSMVVVTDDRAMASQARGGGARVMGTSAFTELLNQARKEGGEFLSKHQSRSHGFHRPFEGKL